MGDTCPLSYLSHCFPNRPCCFGPHGVRMLPALVGSKREIWILSLISLQRGLSLPSKVPCISSNSQPPLTKTEDTCCPKASGLPRGYVPISHEPVDQLFSHNAVGMCPQPVAMVLKFHPTVMMADFLPQIFQLDWVLDRETCTLITSLILALVPMASTQAFWSDQKPSINRHRI